MFCSHLSFINLSLSLTPSLSRPLFLAESKFSSRNLSRSLISLAVPLTISRPLPPSLYTSQSHQPPFVFPPALSLYLSKWRGRILFFPSSHYLPISWLSLCVSLFALCLLVSVEKKCSVFSSLCLSLCQSRRAASSQMLLSSPLLRCMCSLSSLPLSPSLCWSLALWPAEWFAPQLPAVTICPFNAWSADACSLLPSSLHPSPSLHLFLSLCLSSCRLSSLFNHLLLSLFLSSQRRQAPPTGK